MEGRKDAVNEQMYTLNDREYAALIAHKLTAAEPTFLLKSINETMCTCRPCLEKALKTGQVCRTLKLGGVIVDKP